MIYEPENRDIGDILVSTHSIGKRTDIDWGLEQLTSKKNM